jgi:hypothetical protein
MVPDGLLHRARLTVAHPNQIQQLAEFHPEAAASAIEIGDVCYERLLASRPQRDTYRRVMDVQRDQHLVVMSSTWGPTSLLAEHPDLPNRLLAELPLDEYRVALVLHPNVWSFHSGWRLRALHAAALDGGLLLVPPTRGWQAAIIAADVVIGDHGSVSFYSATLGRPTLLAAFGNDATSGTTGAEFGRSAPRLDLTRVLRPQLAAAVQEHRQDRWQSLAERTFAHPTTATARLRSALYDLLKLKEPAEAPRVRAFPAPRIARARITSTLVGAHWTVGPGRILTLERRPAAVSAPRWERPGEILFLAAEQEEADTALLHNASVVLVREPQPQHWAHRSAREALAACPGATVAAAATVEGTVSVAVSDGSTIEASTSTPPADPFAAAAAVYACLRDGVNLGRKDVRLTVAVTPARSHSFTLSRVPG